MQNGKKALIVSFAGIAILAKLNLFVSIQQYRLASALLKLYALPAAPNRTEDQQNTDSIQRAQGVIAYRIENDSIMIVLILSGLWCVPRALKEAKADHQK